MAIEGQVDTDILNPKELFQKQVRYTIPAFQRPYVWSQEDQWEPLWDDVRNVAENYLEELEQAGNDRVQAEQQTAPHFLGAVVLQQVPTAARDIEQREVIDGQQRVTTLQLLLDAIQQICEEQGLRPAATRLAKLVTNDKDLIGDDSDDLFKMWPTRMDRDAFRHAMDNGLPVDGFEESLIVQAHEFFQQQVKKWLEDPTGPEGDRIDALETAVTGMLQMVVIDLGQKDDPNVIFETLNARGTPLEQSDLIKNFVLSQSPKDNTDPEQIWRGLDDGWWRGEVTQGRLRRPRLDMLLNYWLAMSTGEDVGPSKVFDVFRGYTSERGLDGVMSDIKRDLSLYRRFITESRTPEEEQFYYRTNVMQAGVIAPVLLLLLSAPYNARIGAFRALESFLVRRMVCRQTSKDYNRLILDLSVRLKEAGTTNADKIVAGFLADQTAYSREWPTDEAVAASLEWSPIYRLLTRGRLRFVLEGIEEKLRTAKSEPTGVPKNLTIEHLMPVSWNATDWPLPVGVNDGERKETRNRLIHTIGNLTLVNQKLNSAMSNAPWDSKRGELLKHAVLKLNAEMMSQARWDESLILDRSKRMAGLLTECWPGPNSAEWNF